MIYLFYAAPKRMATHDSMFHYIVVWCVEATSTGGGGGVVVAVCPHLLAY
jgi:hypothetical protein